MFDREDVLWSSEYQVVVHVNVRRHVVSQSRVCGLSKRRGNRITPMTQCTPVEGAVYPTRADVVLVYPAEKGCTGIRVAVERRARRLQAVD